MKPLLKLRALLGVALLACAGVARGQALMDQTALLYNTNTSRGVNWQSQRGVPISGVAGTPAGSDGRNSMLPSAPTANQFRGIVTYAGVSKKANLAATPTGTNFAANAQTLDWPRSTGPNGGAVLLVLRANVGAPYLSRQVANLYGSVIPVPNVDLQGNLLTSVSPSEYWYPEPFWTNVDPSTLEHVDAPYYWSPHAGAVFAVKTGPIDITWRLFTPLTNTLANPPSGFVSNVTHAVIGSSYYPLKKVSLIVSGLPVKRPRKMYWTEGIYRTTGRMIQIPNGRVKQIKFLFNPLFPEMVATNEVVQPYDLAITDQARRTISVQNGFITAYNREGRVFMELLGDTRSGAARQFLGFEIVDVVREAIPGDVTIELGERVTAYPDNFPSDFDLTPAPLNSTSGKAFAYQLNIPSANRVELYATHETVNVSDYQVHWLEQGVEGLLWPLKFSRYKFVWPDDPAKYSHYIRPVVADENAAKKTAVKLPTENVPIIEYEDPSTIVRAKLTEDFNFYTFLDSSFPRHRTLIRYNVGEFVAFERVFSILETALKTPNFDATALNGSYFDSDPEKDSAYGQLPLASYVSNGSFTLESWVYLRSQRDAARLLEFSASNLVDTVTFGLSQGSTGMPFLEIDQNSTPASVTGTNVLPVGQWVHLAVSYDVASSNATFYLNGTNLGSGTIAPPRNVARTIALLGRGVHGEVSDAKFDNVRIWSVARSVSDINAGMQISYPAGTAGLVAQYQFHDDNGAAGTFLDSSGNGHDLTTVGDAGSALERPRYVSTSVFVGQRLSAPAGESSSTDLYDYLAGYINQARGTDFSVSAYLDPFALGFEEAARGSIIPINAHNDNATLEVWWFRANHANEAKGFTKTYWPSTIATYSLKWPTEAPYSREIVLASNDGSGALSSLESKGAIYFQNDPGKPGYNPNEEHALMQGGQAYALRDDLNITSATGISVDGVNRPYSSHPYVLLEYADADSRPSMSVFKVLREKGSDTFNYKTAAGTILQPPMPLPLLEKPLGPKYVGQPPRSLNWEIASVPVASSAAINTQAVEHITTTIPHSFSADDRLVLQSGLNNPQYLFVTAADQTAKTVDGYVGANAPVPIAPWTQIALSPASTDTNGAKFLISDISGIAVGNQFIVRNPDAPKNWLATVLNVGSVSDTNQPPNTYKFVELQFPSAITASMSAAKQLARPQTNVALNAYLNWRVSFEALPPGFSDAAMRSLYQQVTMQDRKGNVWVYRGPKDDTEEAYTAMKFYYKTLPGFYFPSRAFGSQPPVGTITPYLRSLKSAITAGQDSYDGDPVVGSTLSGGVTVGANHALTIRYNAVWPESAPVLQMAETLMTPKRGLPAIRGQTSLQVLYQQSQHVANDPAKTAVVLHDPTREKQYILSLASLNKIPDSIRKSSFQGKTYFPNLPPHLAERLFLDPNRGPLGALVLKGKFVDEALGDDYLLLNVLGAQDREAVKALCVTGDPLKATWDAIFDQGQLTTSVQLFAEDPGRPGTYIPTAQTVVDTASLSKIVDDDQAVDSYALTAQGPGYGYVTLIAGNGLAFTPVDEPVTVQVIKVAPTLYRGEVKIVQSSNPLNEKLTLQQVVDLAGDTTGFEFEWLITAPVDGAPPPVFENTRRLLMGDGTWTHLRHPLAGDNAANAHLALPARLVNDTIDFVTPISAIPFVQVDTVTNEPNRLSITLQGGITHALAVGNLLSLINSDGISFGAKVKSVSTVTFDSQPATNIVVEATGGDLPATHDLIQISEASVPNTPQSVLTRTFDTPATAQYSQFYLSLELAPSLSAKVYIDGQFVVSANIDANDTPMGSAPADFSPLSRVYPLGAQYFAGGITSGDTTTHRMAIEIFSVANPGVVLRCNARVEAYESVDLTSAAGSPWLPLDPIRYQDGLRAVLGGTADVRSLSDNYLIMRYRATNTNHVSYQPDVDGVKQGWSRWTEPQLAEGWIKRVLAGINPFNQRVTDLFNNRVNTDVSLITQAGQRWEGDVALNLESMNNYGLIEIYETVLRRGRMLSIDAGINYGPANDALLLAAGYLNDLYMLVGNEAWADAANPTISIGTKDQTFGDIATALFAFKGQVSSLLEEELALLRGRDDFLQPGVEVPPVYNRLVWNYTRGIDAGEVIYALNYNIQENNDTGVDGVINADDARKMFPQGHGDAYGHYLTALKGYYALLMDTDFDWVPRSEAVTVLGKPVQVDYQDERKFAAAAAALARTGRQIFDLSWRQNFVPGEDDGWESLSETKSNTRRTLPTTRYWGADHWATRVGQGAYFNWALGNAILPAVDNDPSHEGIQKIDRTTVPELKEIVLTAQDLQTALDNAEAHLTPLGLPAGAMAFDINPSRVGGANPETHFEQIYSRAKVALNNAIVAFDDAKDVTRLLRSEQDSLADFQAGVAAQETAYENSLIELYGTPYPDDIGPGKTYVQDYAGPDLLHYTYVEIPESSFNGNVPLNQSTTFKIDIQQNISDWQNYPHTSFNFLIDATTAAYTVNQQYVEFVWGPHGYYGKPSNWIGQRESPGKLQQAISDLIKAHESVRLALDDAQSAKASLDKAVQVFNANLASKAYIRGLQRDLTISEQTVASVDFATKIIEFISDHTAVELQEGFEDASEGLPQDLIAGLAAGGDLTAPARAFLLEEGGIIKAAFDWAKFGKLVASDALSFSVDTTKRWVEFDQIAPEEQTIELRDAVVPLDDALQALQGKLPIINQQLRLFDDAKRAVKALEAQGQRIQREREVFRQRTAAVVQGYRTRDAAFRIFRTEKLERYKTLFDLAARYEYLAATAFDYETGLLNTDQGKAFINRIVNSRALGVVKNGEPQFAGSDTGDPGLSSVLAEMKADWDVLKGRLGFNNPAGYHTVVSLRQEKERIIAGADGLAAWKDVLSRSRMANITDDDDVKRYCLQVARGSGLPTPGLVIEFSTTISDGLNLFGRDLAGGDHYFPSSAFATKIFGIGVALEGYVGMDDPVANTTVVNTTGSSSPSDPTTAFLNSQALAATPGIYLIPVGVDVMRSPPLGDVSTTRQWSVSDVAIPMPFNIGGSAFSTAQLWQSSSSLSEPLFATRKHGEFRPVPTAAAFATVSAVGTERSLSEYTSNRLIGRSAWNTKWKLVIPGHKLLANPDEGLERFLNTVTDIKLNFVTYSYSGN